MVKYHRILHALLVSFLLTGCAAIMPGVSYDALYKPVDRAEGNGILQTHEGMDVWIGGVGRPHRVLGFVGYTQGEGGGLIARAIRPDAFPEVARLAREKGGDAVIFLGGESKTTGYSLTGASTGHQTLGGAYIGGSSGHLRQESERSHHYAVIKYLD